MHSLDGSKEIKAGRAVRMHEEILEPSNESQTFEETESETYAISLKNVDKRCSNIELQFSKILAKLDALEKCVKLD